MTASSQTGEIVAGILYRAAVCPRVFLRLRPNSRRHGFIDVNGVGLDMNMKSSDGCLSYWSCGFGRVNVISSSAVRTHIVHKIKRIINRYTLRIAMYVNEL